MMAFGLMGRRGDPYEMLMLRPKASWRRRGGRPRPAYDSWSVL